MRKNPELYEAMRRAVSNTAGDSKKAEWDYFLAEMQRDPGKWLPLLAKAYFDLDSPQWDREQIGIGRTVIVSPEVRAAQRAESRDRTTAAVERLKSSMVTVVFMDVMLPCGKMLRNATFADCAKAGGWFATISRCGKPNESVGKKLTETDVAKLYQRETSKAKAA